MAEEIKSSQNANAVQGVHRNAVNSKTINNKKKKSDLSSSGMEIPDYQFESLAHCLLPKIQKYYENEEGEKAFISNP